ncbi:MAG: SMP-30/gluconolactonase/LRE family protein [Cytophagales bacterium]|nr:SMP-30/gluconolactonase/LRE family protein [Rhizobacter sp.]
MGGAADEGLVALDAPPSLLGESPLWHPVERVLYWCDIPGRALNRFDPTTSHHDRWSFDTEPASIAPMRDGGLLLAMRDGLWRFDTTTGKRSPLATPPYDTRQERFNDGKCDPQGRFWVSTIYEPRDPPLAALYRYAAGKLVRMAGDITVGNGLGWSPDARTMYCSDTKAHTIYAFDFDIATGGIGPRRVFACFATKQPEQDLSAYGGRPDGAAVDAEGGYWSALFEGQRLVRLSPQGEVTREIRLPVRCATMPCFGGPDLKTLYITTSRENRPAAELEAQPLAGRVLTLKVDVPGLPANSFT